MAANCSAAKFLWLPRRRLRISHSGSVARWWPPRSSSAACAAISPQSARSAEVTGSREIGYADAPRFTQIARAPVERLRQAATSGR